MRGQVLGTDAARGIGVLVGAEGERLEFPLSEWRSAGAPVAGQWVDYVVAEGQARQVYSLPAGAAPGVPHAAHGAMATVLGGISVGCLLLGFVIPILPTIAALVLGLIGARRAKAEGDETGLVLSRIGWIGAAALLAVAAIFFFALLIFVGGVVGLAGAMGWIWPFSWQ